MRGLPDYGLWKIETCWRCNIVITKLRIEIVQLVCYNKIIYQIMYRMNNYIKKEKSFAAAERDWSRVLGLDLSNCQTTFLLNETYASGGALLGRLTLKMQIPLLRNVRNYVPVVTA
jgi:hypothetical protein